MDEPRFKLYDVNLGLWITAEFDEYVSVETIMNKPNLSQGFVQVNFEYLNEVEIVWPDEKGKFNEPDS